MTQGTDLCTDVGVLELADHPWREFGDARHRRRTCPLPCGSDGVACAAAGTARWCLDAAIEYLRTREQFGKPVGTFQALQHKAAMLLVNAELAAAAAWDAVRAADDSVDQHRLAAAAAALMAVMPAPTWCWTRC